MIIITSLVFLYQLKHQHSDIVVLVCAVGKNGNLFSQAVKNVLPALANEVITMVKESSICSTYSMMELMWAAKNVAGTTGISVGPYVLVAAIYFCINFPASKAIEAIERRMRRGDKR